MPTRRTDDCLPVAALAAHHRGAWTPRQDNSGERATSDQRRDVPGGPKLPPFPVHGVKPKQRDDNDGAAAVLRTDAATKAKQTILDSSLTGAGGPAPWDGMGREGKDHGMGMMGWSTLDSESADEQAAKNNRRRPKRAGLFTGLARHWR